MINKLAQEIHANNKAKGFYEDKKNIGEMLALIHSEVSEALEADRNDKYCHLDNKNHSIEGITLRQDIEDPKNLGFRFVFETSVKNTFEDELADIIIRVMDLAAFKGIDLEAHIKAKIRYNALRPYKHNKKY